MPMWLLVVGGIALTVLFRVVFRGGVPAITLPAGVSQTIHLASVKGPGKLAVSLPTPLSHGTSRGALRPPVFESVVADGAQVAVGEMVNPLDPTVVVPLTKSTGKIVVTWSSPGSLEFGAVTTTIIYGA